MLAQEIYNQRPGRYTFTVRIAALADSESVRAWASRFRTRIVIFRFTDLSRSLQHTAEVVSVPFAPPFGTAPIEISVSRLLKDQEGGAGELLKGIGVAVVLEHTGDPIDLAASKLKRAVLRIQQARVRFLPRDFSFASHDENRDGKLERSEVPRFLEADFDTLDANGDGSLSPAEVQG